VECVTLLALPARSRESEADRTNPFLAGPVSEPGLAFYSCMAEISETGETTALTAELRKPEAAGLKDAYGRLHQHMGGRYVDADGTDVVADLDSLGLAPEVEACFLRLVEAFLPDRMPDLVCACAAGNCLKRIAAALELAVRSPALVDAWVSGALAGPASDPVEQPWPVSGGAANALGLALLRRWAFDPKTAERALKWLRPRLSPEMVEAWRFFHEGATPDAQRRLLRCRGWRGLACAVEAGAELREDADSLRRFGLNEPDFWWLLAAAPPSAEQLAALLTLDEKLRAVVGLCAEQELHKLRTDPVTWQAILECRRGRLLGRVTRRTKERCS